MSFLVKPKLNVCLDCHTEKFSLSDVTGPYHATLNPNGWAEEGSGDNIEISDVESSGLTITSPAGTVYGPYDLMKLTVTTASFTVPAVGSTVTIALSNASPYFTAWMQVGMSIRIQNAGIYTVVSFTATSAVVRNAGTPNVYYPANTNAGPPAIAAGRSVGIAALPAATGETFLIDPTDILGTGDGEALTDGYWQFDWTVQGVYGNDDTPFHARCLKQSLSLCAVECCVDGLVADSDPSCGCSKTGNKKSINAFLTLAAIKARDAKNNREGAKSLLSKLQDICANNCKNC